MLFSSFSTRSMVFAYFAKAQLPFSLFRDLFNDTAEFTLCYGLHDCSHLFQGYFIHSLSTLYYYNAPSLATRLTGDYRDRTYTGKCGPASLDTPHSKGDSLRCLLQYLFGFLFLTSYKDNTCTSKNYYNNSNYNWNQLINISSFWCGSIYRW